MKFSASLPGAVAFLSALPAYAAPVRPAVKVPTCAAIGGAVAASCGPIASVTDNTAAVQQAAAGGSVPYAIVRACDVHVPGPQKLDGAGYGDLAYLTPQYGGGSAVEALVGNVVFTVGTWASAQETRNMAAHIVGLMR